MRRASMTMWSGISGANGSELPVVQREARGESFHALPDGRNGLLVSDVVDHLGDERAHFAHLGLLEAAGGHGRGAEADTAGVERLVHVEGNRVLVDGDAGAVE